VGKLNGLLVLLG